MKLNEINYENFIEIGKSLVMKDECIRRQNKIVSIFSGKWMIRVFYELSINETRRFGELKKDIVGITNAMLIDSLKKLETAGLILRKQYNEVPPHVEYSITEKGKALLPIFFEFAKWAEKYDI